ncbi:hypothetical protein BDW22DRAFT_1432836 [Trametopsis cervina]|nr:hypothetical protein BDW22DRAFT_1432836 [Trametopsis cervina]
MSRSRASAAGKGKAPAAATEETRIKNVRWDDPTRTDRLIEWMVNNPDGRMALYPPDNKAVQAETGTRPAVRGHPKIHWYRQIAAYIFERDQQSEVRELYQATNTYNQWTTKIENRVIGLRKLYIQERNRLGLTGQGLTSEQIEQRPELWFRVIEWAGEW